jgi:prepilin-type N-terminal cleavage/methylation domain-containing protein
MNDTRGFSLIEVMVATLILTLGLAGVAAMQLTAMNGIFIASSQANGSATALAWSEWLNGVVGQQKQDIDPYVLDVDGTKVIKYLRENYIAVANFDNKPTDSYNPDTYVPDGDNPKLEPFVQVELPDTREELAACFNGDKDFVTSDGRTVRATFKKEGGTDFTPEDMPPPAPPGARLVMRIAANVPVSETATIELSVVYANAFVRDRGPTMRFVVASNM